jgi:starch-binding outer membrane protein, SusD/RagB family
MKKIFLYLIAGFLLLGLDACKSDFVNPNAPALTDVTTNYEGLQSLIVGTQARYSVGATSSLYTTITANGLTTGELQVLNAGNADIFALLSGGTNVTPTNPVVTNLWTNLNLINLNAESLINGSALLGDPAASASVKIYGHLFKALALGTMAQFWTHATPNTGKNAAYVTRQEALQAAINLLDQADNLLATITIPASFNAAVGSNLNIANALKALSARYNLMLGNYAQALTKANAVNLTTTSTFLFDNVNQNPVFRSSLTLNNVYNVNPNFGLSGTLLPNPADGRIAFYITSQAASGKGFFTSDAAPIPLYLPSEMTLIKAEVLARQNLLTEAVAELNKVITKTTATDPFKLAANLAAYDGAGKTQDEILFEIYRNRCMELYMSGLKLDDSRRFNRPAPSTVGAERNRNYYPFPSVQRDNNPNTPADPTI